MADPNRAEPDARQPALRLLFVALCLAIILQPLFIIEGHASMLAELVVAVVPFAAMYSLRGRSWQFRVALSLAAPFAVIWVVVHGAGLDAFRPGELLSALALLSFVSGCLMHHLLTSEHMNGDMRFGAAALYLLLGFLWTNAYSLAAILEPTAFGTAAPDWNALCYFSFSTLTTLGLGDLTPVSPLARSLAVLEAVAGVLYIGFIVARFAAVSRRSS